MLEQLAAIWNGLLSSLDSLPEDSIAVTVYVVGTIIVLWCWYGVAKRLPNLLGGVSWIILFAILATPTVSDGTNAEIAPAIFGLLFGILTKEQPLVWANASLILLVIGVGLVLGYLWSKYRINKAVSHKSSTPI
ncbi:hypothetical protein IAE19_03550 [Acinetobacter sp. S40]|uniref:hypothetical protein n=1 Tax=unclassified Acinetobacter TaxID=196816 RepID=UPI00190E5B8C|nr:MULTISPECIES: hypothetical protein [unclassified Acinetobacter]MBJ9984513.1 hypothetical protein [Acinetobacter sp. S40]MBK0062230.1 hypothetical protein [Acinetobacter sp. S55]MBK0066034.1 hypothetical protein [Acinetobacter sp. S54]